MMQIIKYPPRTDWKTILSRPAAKDPQLTETVTNILADVRQRGDKALLEYEQRFNHIAPKPLEVSMNEREAAEQQVPRALKSAIREAMKNIAVFHAAQRLTVRKINITPGVVCWQKAVAIEKVGLYIPGGTAPLFSTVLMLAVPAAIAGCKEIILCSPPDKTGRIHPAILFAAHESGIDRIFKTGGAQAIAAMTYGTETIPAVYKIFGPGNRYVTTAKQLVGQKDVAIDMPAGPSEVQIIADDTANPAFVAADILSQAEHGADSQAILLTTSASIVEKVTAEIRRQLPNLPRQTFAEEALENSRIILLANNDEIIECTNRYAPEHLIIETIDCHRLAEQVTNAGSVFLGHYTPESAGDYASGTNHTLPTNGHAKAYSGVNLDSFVKKITFQEITRQGIRQLAPTIEAMAAGETLLAHKNAVTIRIKRTTNFIK
jgi:histidinol dehydrogenase